MASTSERKVAVTRIQASHRHRVAIDIARPLMLGRVPDGIVLHVAVLAVYAVGAYYVALVLTRRRLLK